MAADQVSFFPQDMLPAVGFDGRVLLETDHSLAQEARKPMFHLQSADGALGAHLQAVARSREDFRALAMKIAHRAGLALPTADGR